MCWYSPRNLLSGPHGILNFVTKMRHFRREARVESSMCERGRCAARTSNWGFLDMVMTTDMCCLMGSTQLFLKGFYNSNWHLQKKGKHLKGKIQIYYPGGRTYYTFKTTQVQINFIFTSKLQLVTISEQTSPSIGAFRAMTLAPLLQINKWTNYITESRVKWILPKKIKNFRNTKILLRNSNS